MPIECDSQYDSKTLENTREGLQVKFVNYYTTQSAQS